LWNNVTHLTLRDEHHSHALVKYFGIVSVPFVILVDKQGIIRHSGTHIIDLEDKINKLISQ
jgi:glutaredoxin-related protein